MALKFNGTSIYSINYNNQDILNLHYNGTSIWAKRYTDARIYEVDGVDSDGICHASYAEALSLHNLERISSLDASPSPLRYSNSMATVHWGDVFKAEGGMTNSVMTLPSGDNIRIDTDREIYLSGKVYFIKELAPKIIKGWDDNYTAAFYLSDFFPSFGEAYYTTYWNGVRNGEKASEFCRCWIQFLKMNYTYSTREGYTITGLELFPTSKFKNNDKYDYNYDPEIGGWVLSPFDIVTNSNKFGTNSEEDGLLKQREFRTHSGSSGVATAWRVITCYRTGWGHQHFIKTYGSTVSDMDEGDVAGGFYNSQLAAVKKVDADSIAWMNEEPYAKS